MHRHTGSFTETQMHRLNCQNRSYFPKHTEAAKCSITTIPNVPFSLLLIYRCLRKMPFSTGGSSHLKHSECPTLTHLYTDETSYLDSLLLSLTLHH